MMNTDTAAIESHEITNESRFRGGQTYRRAVCTCGWTSTWQVGPETMAINAGLWHRTHAIADVRP